MRKKEGFDYFSCICFNEFNVYTLPVNLNYLSEYYYLPFLIIEAAKKTTKKQHVNLSAEFEIFLFTSLHLTVIQ